MFGSSQSIAPLRNRTASRAGLVLTTIAATALLVACGGDDDKKGKATQVAAKVNKEEITVHEINFVLQRQAGIKPEQKAEASRVVLESLISKELAFQKAVDQKIDRDPNVVEAIEMTKKDLVVQAFFERVASAARQPTEAEIKEYYDKHPALFSERRIYNFQEMAVEATPAQVESLKAKMSGAKTLQDLEAMFTAEGARVTKAQVVRPAEQLPLAQLDAFAQMKDGQVTVNTAPPGLRVLVLAGSEQRPVAFDKAKGVIEMFLVNERKRQLIEAEAKALRTAAKIEYVGEFAASAPKAGASAPGVAAPANDASAPAIAPEQPAVAPEMTPEAAPADAGSAPAEAASAQ